MSIPPFDREHAIFKLEIMRGHDMFEGEPEEEMDFAALGDADLEWYWENWCEHHDEEAEA